MFRLLALLQLTRAALAFTAIADAWTVLLLTIPNPHPNDESGASMSWTIVKMLVVSVVSAGLYGFGMSLNDLLDARRDRIFAPRRPIPSGRIRPRTAIVVALLLLMISLLAAAMLGAIANDQMPWPFLFAFATAILIVFYDATAKYLGAVGILTLGAIRALHCLIAFPKTPLLFLSMFLLTHIFFVSLLAYRLENKRPRLRKGNVIVSLLGLALGNGAALTYMHYRGTFEHPLGLLLLGPSLAMALFALWTLLLLRHKSLSGRQKGDRLMLLGLFWLFVYDASMLFSNGQWRGGLAVVLLFICAIISFFVLRTLGRMMMHPRVQYRLERPLA